MSGNYPDGVTQGSFDAAHNEMDEPRDCCPRCGNAKEWRECYNCEDGLSDHDCGEDCCCCLEPENNVRCDICEGSGGWMCCMICAPES